MFVVGGAPLSATQKKNAMVPQSMTKTKKQSSSSSRSSSSTPMLIPAKASGVTKRRPVGMAGAPSSSSSTPSSTSSSPRSSFSSTHSASSSRSSSPTSSPRFRDLDLPMPPPPYYEHATSAVPCKCQGGVEARCGPCIERQVETIAYQQAMQNALDRMADMAFDDQRYPLRGTGPRPRFPARNSPAFQKPSQAHVAELSVLPESEEEE